MSSRSNKHRLILLAIVAAACLLSASPRGDAQSPTPATQAAEPERTTVVVLATTDLHGNIYPLDPYTNRPSNRGLAKIATLVGEARTRHPGALLIDCGDTIEGSPLEYVQQRLVQAAGDDAPRDPMMAVMNFLGYDAMVVGNQEFNFGLKVLHRARNQADFPWLSANVTPMANAEEAIALKRKQFEQAAEQMAERTFEPMTVEEVHGVKVAIIGLTTTAIPNWEPPEHIDGYKFEPAAEAARFWVKHARENREADVVILGVHSGLERDPKSGEPAGGDLPGENTVYQLAAGTHGVDAIVFGHTHQAVAGQTLNDVLLVQPRNFGQSLAELTFVLERVPADKAGAGSAGGKPASQARWRLIEKTARLIPVTDQTAANAKVLELAKPSQDAAEKYLQTPVAQATQPLEGRFGRIQDTAAMQAIHEVQLATAKADVSFAALFDPSIAIPKGPLSVRQLAALYLYDNTLYAVEMTGAQMKAALEHSARYFNQYHPEQAGPLISSNVQGFNYDTAAGVSYMIDLSQPAGSRIVELRLKGEPLDPARKLRVAVNSYRQAGGGGYTMFRDAPVLWRSRDDVRQLMIDYYTAKKTIDARPANNWQIIPDAARRALLTEIESAPKK